MRLKNVLTIFLSVLILFTVADAKKKKKDRAGKIKDGIYTDSKYNFSFNLPDGWKRKVHKKNDIYRITLTNKEFGKKMKDLCGNTQKQSLGHSDPLLGIWVIETDLSVFNLLDSIISPDSYKKLEGKLIGLVRPNWEDAEFRGYKVQSRKKLKISEHQAISWIGILNFSLLNFEGFDSPQGVGIIVLDLNKNSNIVLIVRTEPDHLGHVLDELKPTFESINFK